MKMLTPRLLQHYALDKSYHLHLLISLKTSTAFSKKTIYSKKHSSVLENLEKQGKKIQKEKLVQLISQQYF